MENQAKSELPQINVVIFLVVVVFSIVASCFFGYKLRELQEFEEIKSIVATNTTMLTNVDNATDDLIKTLAHREQDILTQAKLLDLTHSTGTTVYKLKKADRILK